MFTHSVCGSFPQAMYRKEEVGDLLALRYDDTPQTTGNDKTDTTADYMQEVDVRYPRGTMQVGDGGIA